jgi:proteasome accessory factor A
MARRPLGIETEYGISRVPTGNPDRGDAGICDGILSVAMKRFPYLPAGRGNGLFLGNGSRFYIDCGGHPEYATPEVENPRDVVRYADAGAEFLHGLASELTRELKDGTELLLFRCNVDYLTGTTWACHENYGHRAIPLLLPPQIIPHLVSRIIYTGAGGLDPFSPGIEFCLSPRVLHLVQTTSSNSTGSRGIYHLKDESLSAPGWNRMHVLCGDSLCSQLGTWLKIGATALVVALVEGGLKPANGIELKNPLQAMHRFNRDIALRSTAELCDGRHLTALDLQWHYLSFVREHLDHPCLPDWAEEVCNAWQEMLERLARGPEEVGTRIDWVIKHALYFDHIRRREVSPEELAAYNNAMPRQPAGQESALADISNRLIEHALADSPELQWACQRSPLADIAGPSNHPGLAAVLAPPAKAIPLSQARHKHIQQVRLELCELEVRFGQLGPNGLFAALDRANLLHHRLAGLTAARVRKAMREPPQSGRARLRGQTVQRLHGSPRHVCDWDSVWTNDANELLDLSDPLLEEMPAWTRSVSQPPQSSGRDLALILDQITGVYEQGRYPQAYASLREFVRGTLRPDPSVRGRYYGLMALVQSRRGSFPEAMAALGAMRPVRFDSFSSFYEYVAVHRFKSLVPGAAIWEWIRRGDELPDQNPAGDSAHAFGFHAHKGCALLHGGRLGEARDLLRRILADSGPRRICPRMYALATADLGEVHRRIGEPGLARIRLDDAERIQTDGGFLGDLAEFTLLNRAKLESAARDVSDLLERAETIQIDTINRMGLARTLILRARLLTGGAGGQEGRQRIVEIQQQLPSLQDCPVLAKILASWHDWCAGRPPPEGQDQFWGM